MTIRTWVVSALVLAGGTAEAAPLEVSHTAVTCVPADRYARIVLKRD